MSRVFIKFDCPWCDRSQEKGVYPFSEVEVICDICKRSIGIQTNEKGYPMRIGRLVSIEKLMQAKAQNSNDQPRTDIRGNNPSISIGNVYGSVAVGGEANTTNVYEQTIKIINEAQNVSESQKAQAKNVLEHAKTYAAQFLPVIAEALKKSLGL